MKPVRVRCPRCADLEHVAATATAARCKACAARWRWAACQSCDTMQMPFEWDESWRCNQCGVVQRSWWRTPDADSTGRAVAQRRAKEADSGLKPWLAGVAALVALLVVGGVLSIPHTSAADRRRQAARPACGAFAALKSKDASGALSADDLRRQAGAIAGRAAPSVPAVRSAAQQLYVATASVTDGPGTDGFLAAESALDDACEAALH